MISLRGFAAITLALVLALTSGTMALARGQTMAMGEIVICTGTGPQSLAVDAEGNPIGPTHICPDCALSLFAAVAVPPATVPAIADWRPAVFAAPPTFPGAERSSPAPTARGPPSLI